MRDYADAWKGIHFVMNKDFSPLISLVTKAERTCSHYSLIIRKNLGAEELQ